LNIENLNSFLDFGYFLGSKNEDYTIDFSKTNKEKYINFSLEELTDKGIYLWEDTIEKQFISNEKNVVPLSGGLDSRAILGTLLKFTEAKNINTYTYGTPNTLDYDIGNEIAKKFGTKHISMPLTEYTYDMDTLLDVSKRIDRKTLLFLHGPIDIIDREFGNANTYSGAIIDVFFGRHTHINKADNWNQAILNSFHENQYTRSIKLSNCTYNNYFNLVDYDKNYEEVFEFEHVIDLMNRQIKFIAPHVLMKGLNYKTLFNNDLSDFANSIPNKYRENQILYKEMFIKAYPELFSIRTKNSNGLSLNASKNAIFIKKVQDKVLRALKLSSAKGTNYLDFNEKIRTKKDLRDIISMNVMDLKSRNIIDWIDIELILKNHLSNKGDFADALIVLASLEIHLKSGLKL
jgi:hypothetical protein